jgi:hypothetical protein
MSTVWTWYRPFGENETAANNNGWHIENAVNIAAPESIQRVIVSASAVCSDRQENAVPVYPFGTGMMRSMLILTTDHEEVVWDSTAVANVDSFIGPNPNAPDQTFAYVNLGVHEPGVDMRLRRAAPPPPAAPLNLDLVLDFQWSPNTAGGFWWIASPWIVRWSFFILTSQPGVAP